MSGTSEIKYAIIEESTESGWTWPAADAATIAWQTYNAANKPSVDPNKNFVVYAYATDNAGNKSNVIRTDGTVLYTDATESATVNYTKLSNVDKVTDINIGSNTIREVYNMTVDATTALNNGNSQWYYVNGDKKIVLEADSLNTLAAGTYQLHVSYNPNGKAYVKGDDPDNVDARKSVITLNVVKADDAHVPAAPTVITEKTTTSSITLNEIPALKVSTNYGERTIPVEYSCNGGNTWQDSPVFTNLTSGTTYNFTARYAATDDFNASAASAATQGTTIAVKRSSSRGGGSSTTYYTLTVTAGAGGTADVGKISVRSGSTKTINFTPSEGYVVADVVVNNTSVGARTAYTLTNITRNTTVKVTFVKSGNAVVVPTTAVINPSTGAGI